MKLRIPVEYLHKIASDLLENPTLRHWEFTTKCGNKLVVERHAGVHIEMDGSERPWNSLDFEYNPGD